MEAALDAADRLILDQLRVNGRASFAELGRLVGLLASAVHERVGKLEDAGVILGYRAVVDQAAVGLGATALVGIEPSDTADADADAVAESLAAVAEVDSCYTVAGDQAFVVMVRVATVDALEHVLVSLRRIVGVGRTVTTVVLSTRFEGRPNTGGSR